MVTIGKESNKTDVIKKTLTPEWNQTLTFPVTSADEANEVLSSIVTLSLTLPRH